MVFAVHNRNNRGIRGCTIKIIINFHLFNRYSNDFCILTDFISSSVSSYLQHVQFLLYFCLVESRR